VLEEFDSFLCEHRLGMKRTAEERRFIICTDGPWDVKKFLAPEIERKDLPLARYWRTLVNIRFSFAQLFRCKWQNVNSMLNKLDLQFVGRPHSGIDDSRNIAAIAYQVHRQRKLKPNMSI